MSFCVSKDTYLKKDTLQFLYEKDTHEESTKTTEVFGGILSNLHYVWLVRKSRIVVVNCKNALRVGSWDFGNTLQDDTLEINKVEEIPRPNGKEPHLIISLNCETRGGMICIFDFVGSKVIRAIQIVDNITSLHIIDRGQDLFSLSGPLRNFDGVLAVGTIGGNVYILDICRQLCYEGFNSFEARDEMNPCQIKIITAGNLLDLENCKKIALHNESHLAIFLNVVQNKKTEHFVLKGPGGADVLYVNKEEVLISSLHYCPQLSSILVGYNFGAFQLWDLMNMELIYTSPICEDHIPIIKFAIQEPADDPRAFCYVWAVYSTDDLESKVLPNLVMYSLCYESKEFHENYGVLYENFQYCTVRFQRELGFGNNQSNIKPIGGKCLNLESMVLKNSGTNTEIYGNDGTEDALSLCVTAWKAVGEGGQFTYMAVFDLNQWYKAQMPNSANFDDCSSYMITLCISDLTNTDDENKMEIFDVNLSKKSIQQFIGTQRLEEHYYPSSLSFETSCLLECKIVNIQYQGVQSALLCQLQKAGPLCLIRPSETYQEIVALGLTPLFVELNTSAITSLNNQREVILSVALEQQLTSWLCKCASEWANGSFSSAGCSLDLLISWAHRRAHMLKVKCDDLCIPLFDYSDVKLDTNSISILSNSIRQIKNISFIFSYILSKFSLYLTNKDTISELSNHLKMVELYFDVLQWFFNVGLLPEFTPLHHNALIQDDKVRAPYPIKELEDYYMKRRSELFFSVNMRHSITKSVLFIDNLINVEFDNHLENDWRKDGGTGFYPPRSIQAVLRAYLLEGMEVCHKHSLVIYLLLDLAVILDSQYQPLITNLMKFPAVYKVSPSYIKITHGFWQLDHGGYHHAMEQLLDPMINQEDLKNWHHKIALKSLLNQEQPNLALLYMNVRKPPIVDDEDILCALTLFISNKMLDEAFYLEKNFSNHSSSKSIIKHLFTECNHYGRLNSIIYRNLTTEEEAQFLNYLDEVKHPEAADLKITYFMQRSHYKEAFNTYQACEDDPTKRGLISRLNLKARDQIVHSYKKFLPTVSYDFIENCTRDPNPTLWKEVSRPDPMSVCVHKADTKTEYKSSLILAALAKARLTFNKSDVSLSNARTEEIPFLRTPTAVPYQKRSSVQVIIPKIVIDEVDEEEDGPSPPKRSKLSFSSTQRTESEMNSSILSTPIIERKVKSYISPIERDSEGIISTPASILKVRSSYKSDLNNISTPTDSSNTPSRRVEHKSFISGRKSTRTSTVRFDVPSSSPEALSSLRSSLREVQTPERNDSMSFENSSKSISHSVTPKNISDTDDTFYSPNSSLNNIDELPKDTSSDEKRYSTEEQLLEPTVKISPKKPAVISKAELVKIVDYTSSSDATMSSSIKGRRSYRKISDVSSIRSSPRLSKNRSSNETIKTDENIPSPGIISTAKSRKSLNREVLESNTLARIACSADSMEITRTEIFKEERKISSWVIDSKNSEISRTKIEYADSYIKESSKPEKISEMHSISRNQSYITETTLDSDTSEESLPKFDDNATLGVSESMLDLLTEDLHKRSSQADTSEQKGIAREQTPLRRTRTSSRISERIFTPEKSQNENKEKLTEGNDYENLDQQSGQLISLELTSFATSSSSIALNTSKASLKKIYESPESSLLTSHNASDHTSEESSDQNPLPQELLAASTPYLSSSQRLKINRAKKSKHPLSRQVLEYNALSRLITEYETSSTEEMEVDEVDQTSRADIKMLERSCLVNEKESNISISDSVLEMLAYGKLRRERDYLQKQEESMDSPEERKTFNPVKEIVSGENELSAIPQSCTTKESNNSVSDSVLEMSAEKSMSSSEERKSLEPVEDVLSEVNEMEMIPEISAIKRSNISVSDSVLDMLAYGKLHREREHLHKYEESMSSPEKKELLEPIDNVVSGENKLVMVCETSATKQSNISLSDSVLGMLAFQKSSHEKQTLLTCGTSLAPLEKPKELTEVDKCITSKENNLKITPGISAEVEIGKENMSLVEACSMIYDDLDDENIQNNPQSHIFENEDYTVTLGMFEHSTDKSGLNFKSEQLRQEVMFPTALEKNISESDSIFDESSNNVNKISKYTEVIEILSSDGSESKSYTASSSKNKPSTSNDYLEKNISESHIDLDDPSLIFVSDSNNEKSHTEFTETLAHVLESDENTKCNKYVNTKNINKGQLENETEQSVVEESVRSKVGRRITRRSSKLLNDQDDAGENKTTSKGKNDELENKEVLNSSTTRRVSLRRLSQTSELNLDQISRVPLVDPVSEQSKEIPKSIISRKRTRSVDIPLKTPIEENKSTTSKSSDILRARRKLRSASVDIPNTIDEESREKSGDGESKNKPTSMSDTNDIQEEEKSNKKLLKAIKEDLVENYKKERRLTRRQSIILEQSMITADLSSMDSQDSIELLDKNEFKDIPDPMETKVYETSPSSSASTTKSNVGRPARRLRRTNSNASDDSVTSGTSSPGRRKNSVIHVNSPIPISTRRKLRSASTEENPECKSPEQKKDKTSDIMSDDSMESDTSVLSTRSRTSTKSDSNKSSKARKRKIATKSALPEISEENLEVVSGSPAQNTRRGRKNVQK